MRRRCTLFVLVLAAALIAPSALVTTPAAAAEPDRVSGASRIETAVAIAQRSFPDGAQSVYLARADLLVDALAAGTLTDGPVLLVPSCGDVPGAVVDEVERLDVEEVVALGGESAVCDATLRRLGRGASTDRLSGEGRIETALAISERAFPDSASIVYLANAAEDAPDAVAGGSLTEGPILLTGSDGEPDAAVRAEVDRLDPEQVVALGGIAAVADETLAATADGRSTDRIAGPSRLETAIAIAETSFPQSADAVYLARADVFADAVAAGSLTDGPVLLVPSCARVPTVVSSALERLGPDDVVALGGPAAVCDGLLRAAADGGDGLGELLFTRGTAAQPLSTGSIWTMQPDGSGAARLSPEPAAGEPYGGPGWSDDGRYVSYIELLDAGYQLAVIDTLDPELAPRRPADLTAVFGHPCEGLGYLWMPDNSGLVANCDGPQKSSAAVVRLDGSVRRIPLTDPSSFPLSLSVSPDSTNVVIVEVSGEGQDERYTTLRADLTTSPLTLGELPLPAFHAVYAADGSQIFYEEITELGSRPSVRAARPDGTGDRQVLLGDDEFGLIPDVVGPDGMLYLAVQRLYPNEQVQLSLDRLDLTSGTRTTVVAGDDTTTYVLGGFDPDEDRLVATRGNYGAEGQLTRGSGVIVQPDTGALTELPSEGRDVAFSWRPAP